MYDCAMPRGKTTYVCTYLPLHKVQLHAACVFVLERRKLDQSLICCLKDIFKDLAVPAVTRKLTLGSWFVLAVAMFY